MKYLENNLKQAEQRYTSRLWYEILVVLSLISGLAAIGVAIMPTFTSKAELSEVLTSFPIVKERVSQYYMETGRWPEKYTLDDSQHYSKEVIERIEFDGNGTINYFLSHNISNMSGKIVSFSASTSESEGWQNLVWVCGYAKPIDGYQIQGKNMTNIDSKFLPQSCKN